jgi:erythromycin esterase
MMRGGLVAIWFVATMARAQAPFNPGFESVGADGRPSGWMFNGPGYEIVLDSANAFAGRLSLRTRWLGSSEREVDDRTFAVGSQQFPLAAALGRRLRLTGFIRTEDVRSGYAGFWMRVDGPSGMLALENMTGRGATATTPWTRYTVEIPVDSGAERVFVGPLHPGSGTAWFDSLTFEVVGPPMPRTAASFKASPRPEGNMRRLLTDAELAVPPDSVAGAENESWRAWVRANAHPIRSLGADNYSDLRFLRPLLEGKRIVQLGESGHGVAEFSMTKVRLIKYLHEELGYDVIAFESSLFECDRAQRRAASLDAATLMRSCIFGVWHAEEVLPLFEYIKQTHDTPRPLILAGFDVQTSTPTASARPAFLRDIAATVDTAYAERVHALDATFLNASRQPNSRDQIALVRDRLVAFYDSLEMFLAANRRRIEAAQRHDPDAALIARQTAVSMSYYVRQLATGLSKERSEIRDRGMADNLDFLLDVQHRGKKVITWAHNFHIQHRASSDGATPPAKTMGVWVAERRRAELYTVGFYMYRGAAALNNRRVYPVSRMPSGGLESILHGSPWRYSFLDLSRARQEPGTEWMWRRIPAMGWGTQPERLVPRDEYDGILFIDRTHPPRYLTGRVLQP